MNKLKRKRQRGVILTPTGLLKLQQVKIDIEADIEYGKVPIFADKLSELSQLDMQTVKKILACKVGVDKRTLECLFDACDLELSESCYSKLNPNRRQDWGEAVDVSVFYGRTSELEKLEKLVFNHRCRLVALLGMGGIGKTTLSIKFAQQVETKFDCVIWKSLRDAPPVEEVLANLIEFLSEGKETEANLPERVGERITRLINYLRSLRCLVVLDNGESLLDSGSRIGKYRSGYEGYGELLRRVGATEHTSCLMLTTREKPKEVAILEGENFLVRSLPLEGFKKAEGLEIFQAKGLLGSESELNQLSDRYGGNPLALKVVATTIQELFEGNIAAFLCQEQAVFGNIRDVLDQQFERLSKIEKEVMFWLAIAREPISISQLREHFVLPVPLIKLVEALESLSRRSLIEKNASRFTQQPVVMEYVTSRLIEGVCDEIVTGERSLVRDLALIQATAKDYIRETQIRLILQPVINELLAVFGSKRDIENRLTQIVGTLREDSPRELGYTAGNIINLFCQMETDLTGYDFSNLCVWQADLRNVCLHDVNFQNADLFKTVFAETFGGVLSVAFSPDGTLLAAGDTNGEIHLRQVSDGKQILTLKGHTNWVTSVAFSPDGHMLVSGSTDHTVKLWNINTGQCLYTLQEHENEVWSVAFSPDGSTLASGCDDQKIRLWNVQTGQCLRTFHGHTSWVLSVAFSPDGSTLASGCDDQKIRLWNVQTGQCLRTFHGHSNGIRSITFSPNGQILASGSEDYTVKLWDVNTGECLKTFQGHSNGIYSVAYSLQGNFLASGSYDQMVKLWDVSTGKCLQTFQGHSSRIWSVAFSPQDNLIASGSHDQTVKLWSINNGQCLKTFQGNTAQLLSVSYSPDGHTLASASQDCTIRLWDVDKAQVLKTFQGHKAAIWSVTFSPNGRMLASGSDDRTVKLWNIATGQAFKTFQGHNNQVLSVAFSPDGKMLASGSEDRTVKLWDIATGQALRTFMGHCDVAFSVAFNPQGNILASGGLDRTVRLWNISTGECFRTLEGHTNWVWSVAFSPNGKLLASASSDRTLKLWSVDTGEYFRTLSENIGVVQSVAFSPDSQTIASSSQDYTIKLWDVKTGQCFSTLPGHTSRVWSVVFSPDGKTLASGSEDETIRLWNVTTGECVKTLKVKKPYERMNLTDVTGLTKATIETIKMLGATNSYLGSRNQTSIV